MRTRAARQQRRLPRAATAAPPSAAATGRTSSRSAAGSRRVIAAHEVGQLAADRKPEPRAAELARRRFVGLRERLEDRAASRPHPCRCRYRSRRSARPRDPRRSTATSARTTTSPCAVNFTALPTRFIRIWRTRNGSPSSVRSARAGGHTISSMPLSSAAPANRLVHSSSTCAEIDRQRFERDLAGADLRQVEQVVDDLQQDLRRGANGLGEMRLRRRQRRARQQLGHADDAVHRRAQLVAHAIEEVALRLRRLGELAVALDQLARAQLHFGFEAFARCARPRGTSARCWCMR